MAETLKVLLLEDEAADAELAARALRQAGLATDIRRVQDRESFVAALTDFAPDIVLADYHLPSFDGLAALRIAQELVPDIPFIFVSGVMGEELAIETLHQGASDYVIKDRLGKLAPAVRRALEVTAERRRRHRAESELAASEERFRKIAESAHDGLIIIDSDERVSYWNQAASDMFGYTAAEAIGCPLHQLVAPARYRDDFRRGWAEFLRSGEGPVIGHSVEVSALRKDGTEFPVELSISSVTIDERRHAAGLVRDISERQRAEATRRELAAIVESSEDAIFGMSIDGRISTWNAGAVKIFGHSGDEILGRPLAQLALAGGEQEIGEHLANLTAGKSITHYETRLRCKDGHCIDVSLSLAPMRDESGRSRGISGIARDITQRKAAEISLQRSNRFLRTLSRCNEALVHADDEIVLLHDMCRVVVEAGGFPMAWVTYAEDGDRPRFRPMAQFGEGAADFIAALRLEQEAGAGSSMRRMLQSAELQIVADIAADPLHGDWSAGALQRGFRSMISLPLRTGAATIGALVIYAGEAGMFGSEEIGLLKELAADLAFGIATVRTRAQQQESARQLERSLEATIQAIATTLETRDPYTAGHQQRVARLAAAIARDMGLDEKCIAGVERGASIHDIGKIFVPAEILNRPGRLTDIELALIKTHSSVGYDIIKHIDFPWPLAEMILQHHERLDGSGYPKGLKGEAILVEARILAVADVVEAMMNHRPYRPALGLDAAIEEITRHRGDLFDADVVNACERLLREGRFAL